MNSLLNSIDILDGVLRLRSVLAEQKEGSTAANAAECEHNEHHKHKDIELAWFSLWAEEVHLFLIDFRKHFLSALAYYCVEWVENDGTCIINSYALGRTCLRNHLIVCAKCVALDNIELFETSEQVVVSATDIDWSIVP